MVASPVLGFVAGLPRDAGDPVDLPERSPRTVCRGFRFAQTFSAAGLALGHGLQDAQKTMGVIFLALDDVQPERLRRGAPALGDPVRRDGDLARHLLRRLAHHAHARPPDHPPRSPERLRRGVRRRPSVLYVMAIHFQAPVSTTHTITSAIMGAGATRRALRGALGRGQVDRRRLGPHLPGGRLGCGTDLRAHAWRLPAALRFEQSSEGCNQGFMVRPPPVGRLQS